MEKKKEISDEIDGLKEKLEKAEKLAEERFNQLKYLQADTENLRKRYEKEKQEIIKTANEALIKELLVILDSFEVASKISKDSGDKNGLLMLQKKFLEILLGYGLREIETIGKEFNPNFHEAFCMELSKHREDEIIDVVQKGYTLGSRVIRTSKVRVSKGLKNEDKYENKKKKYQDD